MSKVIVQVPMDKKLRDDATKAAKEYGFSSLQEALRFFVKKIAEGKVDINITIRK